MFLADEHVCLPNLMILNFALPYCNISGNQAYLNEFATVFILSDNSKYCPIVMDALPCALTMLSMASVNLRAPSTPQLIQRPAVSIFSAPFVRVVKAELRAISRMSALKRKSSFSALPITSRTWGMS